MNTLFLFVLSIAISTLVYIIFSGYKNKNNVEIPYYVIENLRKKYSNQAKKNKIDEVKENFNDVQNLNTKYNINTYRDKKGRFRKI